MRPWFGKTSNRDARIKKPRERRLHNNENNSNGPLFHIGSRSIAATRTIAIVSSTYFMYDLLFSNYSRMNIVVLINVTYSNIKEQNSLILYNTKIPFVDFRIIRISNLFSYKILLVLYQIIILEYLRFLIKPELIFTK